MATANRAGFRGDTRWLSVPALISMVFVAAAAFILSYQGLATVSVQAGVEPWVIPLFLDGGILGCGLVRAQLRGQRRTTAFAAILLTAATLASAAVNFSVHASNGDDPVVIAMASASPLFFLGFTELIIFAVVQHDVAERPRKKVTATAAPSVSSAPAPQAAPAPKPSAPRTPRASSARKPAALPFDDVIASTEEGLLADLDRLGADPEVSTKGSPESASLTVTVWALVERHNHSVTDLSRRIGHDTADRLKDRLRKARAQAPELADALSV